MSPRGAGTTGPRADLVLEGGGVKGYATVGAVSRLYEDGYTFERVAGTSVGALAAAFIATGMGGAQFTDVMSRLELSRIPDRTPPGIPFLSECSTVLFKSGAYRGRYLRDWLHGELANLGKTTFGDFRRADPGDDENLPLHQRYDLVVMVTDVTHGQLLRLPWDYPLFGLDPDIQNVADAVRASFSIPLFFEPCTLTAADGTKSVLVDGGVLSNFPIEVFDRTDGRTPRWPTIGMRLLPNLPADLPDLFPVLGLPVPPPLRLLEQVVATALVGRDQTHLSRPEVRERTIAINTTGVGITDFWASELQCRRLITQGCQAADDYLSRFPQAPAHRGAVTRLRARSLTTPATAGRRTPPIP